MLYIHPTVYKFVQKRMDRAGCWRSLKWSEKNEKRKGEKKKKKKEKVANACRHVA